jgi:hypothetical protein
VSDSALVSGDAWVYDYARVYDNDSECWLKAVYGCPSNTKLSSGTYKEYL